MAAGRPAPRRVDSLGPHKTVEMTAGIQTAQVSIARTVSMSRGGGGGRGAGSVQRAVAVKQPLRPRVVDVGSRKSTLGLIEGSGDQA